MRRIGLAVVLTVGLTLAPLVAATEQAWDRHAVFAAREAQLKQAIENRPADPQPLVDLAAFYLKPVAPRDVEAAAGSPTRRCGRTRRAWTRSISSWTSRAGRIPKTSW
jgi:hypothetical protein